MDPVANTQENPPVDDDLLTEADPAVTEANNEAGTTPGEVDYSNLLDDENFDPSTLPAELQPAYKQLRADYTRKTQTVAQQRKEAEDALNFVSALQDEGQRNQALAAIAEAYGPDAILSALGYEVGDGELAPVEDEAPSFKDPRVDELARRFEQMDQEAQEKALIDRIQGYTANEFDRLGIEDEGIQELILGRAAVYDLDENGLPMIEQAARDVVSLLDKQRKSYVEQKQNAPAGPIAGSAGQEQVDWSSDEARQAYMASIIEGSNV